MTMPGTKGVARFGDVTAQAISRRFYGPVDAETDLDLIPPSQRVDGMVAVVLASYATWVFDAGSSAAEVTGEVRQPAAGDGRWHIGTAGAGGSLGLQKRTVTIGHAALTDADTSQTISIGAVLPANARILGHSIHTVTAFSGGTVSALAVDIGTSGDIDAIVDGADLFAAAVDGQAATMPAGISPNKLFASAGAQLIATVVSTGDDLVNLTAGTMTIDVLFAVLA